VDCFKVSKVLLHPCLSLSFGRGDEPVHPKD
jgi:hypothetical protein